MAQLSDIPRDAHWAIIETTSVSIPGDERSRANPGHGYPASTETFIAYRAFPSKAEWTTEIERLTLRGDQFRAIHAEVASVLVNVSVA
jgi:hypothetical protein